MSTVTVGSFPVAASDAGNTPSLSNQQVMTSGNDVYLQFDSTESLDTISVEVKDSEGVVVGTLTESDFSPRSISGGVRYQSTSPVTLPAATYDVQIVSAIDSDGNDGGPGPIQSVTIDPPPSVEITNYAASNPSGQTVDVTFDSNESLDTLSLAVIDQSNGQRVATLSETDFTTTSASVYTYHASTDLGTDGTFNVRFQSANGTQFYSPPRSCVAVGSGNQCGGGGGSSGPSVAITSFTATNPSGQDVAISFHSNESVNSLTATIENDSGQQFTLSKSDFTESPDGSFYVYENTTDVDGTGFYWVTIDSVNGTYFSDIPTATVDVGGTDDGSSGDGSSGDQQCEVTDAIEAGSVSHVGGTQPTTMPTLTVDQPCGNTLMGIELRSSGPDPYELATAGVDHTTRFEITVRVHENYDPALLTGTMQNVDWSKQRYNETYYEVTITGQPMETQWVGTPPNTWDGTYQAEFAYDSMFLMSLISTDKIGNQNLQGAYIATDAQSMGTPVYRAAQPGADPSLEVYVAAPHFRKNGETNDGEYEALLPNALIAEWGVENPETELVANYQDTQKSAGSNGFTITETAEGVLIEFPIHYSDGTIKLSPGASGSGSESSSGDSSGGSGTGSDPSSDGSGTDSGTAGDGSDDDSSSSDAIEEIVEPDAADGITGASGSISDEIESVVVALDRAQPNRTIDIAVPKRNTTSRDGVGLSGLNLTVTRETDVTLNVSVGSETPDTVDAPGDDVVSYITVDESVEEDALGTVSFTFTVSDERLERLGASPENATLYRFHDGEWTRLETEHVADIGGQHRYRALSPGLSVFAVRAGTPAVTPGEPSLSASAIAVEEAVTVSVPVSNRGSESGEYVLDLTVDGVVVAERTVTVPADESRVVTLQHEFLAAGEYEVSVDGTELETITVAAATSTPETATTHSFDDGAPTTSGDGPGFGGVAVVLAMAVALALLARRD